MRTVLVSLSLLAVLATEAAAQTCPVEKNDLCTQAKGACANCLFYQAGACGCQDPKDINKVLANGCNAYLEACFKKECDMASPWTCADLRNTEKPTTIAGPIPTFSVSETAILPDPTRTSEDQTENSPTPTETPNAAGKFGVDWRGLAAAGVIAAVFL